MGRHRLSESLTSTATLSCEAVRETADNVRIAFFGEIDLSTADDISGAVTDSLRSLHPRSIKIDLAGVTFIDCSGVTALLRCRGRAARSGCLLAVTSAQPTTYRVLELTGVLSALTGPVQP